MVRAANGDHDSTAEGEQMLECDYLVIGAGASSLSFVDSLLRRCELSKRSVSVVVVDERDEPGGHWNDAYRFARLHRESRHYGVGSKALEPSEKPSKASQRQAMSASKGACHASASEVLAYYGSVMDDMLDTGSVQYFPLCSYRDERVVSLLHPSRVWRVSDTCKIVDSTFMRIVAPSARASPFEVGLGAFVVPPNYLSSLTTPASKYVVIGAGRTGIDTLLWLLSRGVEPLAVQWIMPRDHWFMCREILDGGQVARAQREFNEATQDGATTLAEFANALERRKLLCRLDSNRKQESFHGAIVSAEELAKLKSIEDVVRLGRVRAVHEDHILLERGVVDTVPGTLHIDCTSSYIQSAKDPVPIWQGRKIVLQPAMEIFVGAGELSMPCTSAAIALLEVLHSSEDLKNSMLTAGRFPDTIEEWLQIQLAAARNAKFWQHPQHRLWMRSDRLSLWSALGDDEIKSLHEASMIKMKVEPAGVLESVLKKAAEDKMASSAAFVESGPCRA